MLHSNPQADDEQTMILKDWDIWHSYLLYFLEDLNVLGLGNIARMLVQNNLCAVVYHSDNQIWWKDGEDIREGEVAIEKIDNENWKYQIDANLISKKYSFECATQAVRMRIYELKLFTGQYLETFTYIRGYLNAFYMTQGGRVVNIYPQIKIYDNGVVNLSFRLLAHHSHIPYPVNIFIENEVNLYKHRAECIEVPPEFLKLYIRDLMCSDNGGLISRYRQRCFVKEMDSSIDANIKKVDGSDFTFYVTSVDSEKCQENFHLSPNFDGIKDIIVSSLHYVVNQANENIKFLTLGCGKENCHIGKLSLSRPSIYVLDFVNQPDTSKKVIEEYSNELSKILARIGEKCSRNYNEFLEENLRPFDDYTLHMNQALTLWVFSEKGRNIDENQSDSNRGHLIYEKQVQVESIDYIHMCVRRYAERSHLPKIPYKSSLKEQLNIVKLMDITSHTSYAVELDNLHEFASKKFDLSDILEKSIKNLEIKAELDNLDRKDFFEKLGLIISILFGLGSLSGFNNGITEPTWKYFGIWLPESKELQHLFLIVITALIFVFILLIFVFIFRRIRD